MLISSPTIPEVIFERIKSDVSEFAFNFFQDGQTFDVVAKTYKFRLKASGIQVLEKIPAANAAGRVLFVLSTADKGPLTGSEYSLSLIEVLAGGGERTIVTGTLRWSVPAGKNIGLVYPPDVSVNYISATGSLMVALGVVDFGSSSSALSAAAAAGSAQLANDIKEDTLNIKVQTEEIKQIVDAKATEINLKTAQTILAAESAAADKLLAQQASLEARGNYEEKGDWNAATNTPALTADATVGQTGEKLQRYTIVTGGNLPFAIKGKAANTPISTGYLVQHPTSNQWFYDPADSGALTKISTIENVFYPSEDIGASNFAASNGVNVANRIVFNRQKPVTVAGKVTFLKGFFRGAGGAIALYVFRKNTTATYLEVSRNNVTGLVGLNEKIDLTPLNINVLPGDIFGFQCLSTTVQIGTQSITGSGVYATTPAVPGDIQVINAPFVEQASGVGEACFSVHVIGNYPEVLNTKISGLQTEVSGTKQNVVSNTSSIAQLAATTSDLKSSVLTYEDRLLYEIIGENNPGWNLSTFSAWWVGYLPANGDRISQFKIKLGQINLNEKLSFNIYSRPVADAALASAPGTSANDVLIEAKEFLTTSFANTAAFQEITFDFNTIFADASAIYLFSLKGILAGGAIGSLGVDRASVAANTLQPYQRGGYFNAQGAYNSISAATTFRIAHAVNSEIVTDKLSKLNVDLNTLKTTVAGNVTGIQALNTAVENTSIQVTKNTSDLAIIKSSALPLVQTSISLIPGLNAAGWNANTFKEWAVGYIPLVSENYSQIKFFLGQVNLNQKLRLRIYSRPVSQATSAAFPGSGANDMLLSSTEYLTSLYSNVATIQEITFSFPKFLAATDKIYIFDVSGLLADGSLGALGIDRNNVDPNTLQAYQRGWYFDTAVHNVGASSAFRISYNLYAERNQDNIAALLARATTVETELKTTVKRYPTLGTRLFYDALTAISSQFVSVGWAVVTGGVSPGSNTGLANYLHLNRQYAAARRKMSVKVIFGSDTRFMIFTKPIESQVNLQTIVECDVSAQKIKIYKAYDATSLTLPAVQIELPCAFVSGREYLIELQKDDFNNGIKVTDTLTGIATQLIDSSNLSGRQHDSYAFCNYSGAAPVIRNLSVSTPYKINSFVYVLGDSITEARYTPLTILDGYAYKLLNALSGNGGVSGRGGGNINGVLRRLETEVLFLKPTFVAVTIGTNSGNTLANLTQLCNRIIELGSIPIINNVPTKGIGDHIAKNTEIEQVRTAFGISGCLFDKATSLNYDVAQGQDQSLYNSDSGQWVHPNEQGQDRMFKRFSIDVPELFY